MNSARYPVRQDYFQRFAPARAQGRSRLMTVAQLVAAGYLLVRAVNALRSSPTNRRISGLGTSTLPSPQFRTDSSRTSAVSPKAPAGLEPPAARADVAQAGWSEAGQPRGRDARVPEQIPARGWRDVLMRVYQDLGRDNVSLVAAGLAMYAMLSIFPALTALVSIYGIFVSPAGVVQQMHAFAGIVPPDMWNILTAQLQSVASKQGSTLTLAAGSSLLVALWSARSGMSSLMTAMNIAFAEQERRGIVRQVFVSLAFTLGAVIAVILMLGLLVVVPVALRVLGTAGWANMVGQGLRFVLLMAFAVIALDCVYRFAPSRTPIRWRWATWGSTVAALLWVIASALFALYVQKFAGYQKAYGALGGVIVMLMWLYLSSFIILLGAELNAELERQTRKDTTAGAPKPMGQRGARAADTIGPSADALHASSAPSTHTV
jgi:membrane protein